MSVIDHGLYEKLVNERRSLIILKHGVGCHAGLFCTVFHIVLFEYFYGTIVAHNIVIHL